MLAKYEGSSLVNMEDGVDAKTLEAPRMYLVMLMMPWVRDHCREGRSHSLYRQSSWVASFVWP